MRTAVVAVAVGLAFTALPASAATALPPPNKEALTAAIAGLPNQETTGALVRITGPAPPASPICARAPRSARTKVYTAVMVLQLAQEHRIDLNEPVQRYLPGLLPAAYPPVPVYTLLVHTSGLPSVDIPGLDDPEWILANRFAHWSPREVVDTALRHPIDFQADTAQKYTNTAYVTAGMIIEEATGRPTRATCATGSPVR